MSSQTGPSPAPAHDPYEALRFSDFRLLLFGNLFSMMGRQMLAVVVGWDLYNRTGSALVLGIVGLVQVVPVLLFALVAGHMADRYDRKLVLVAAQAIVTVASAGLTVLSYSNGSIPLIYACLFLGGIGGSFTLPVTKALGSEVVPEEALENSATWQSSSTQLAAVVGPAIAGLVIAVTGSVTPGYLIATITAALFVVLPLFVRGPVRRRVRTVGVSAVQSLGEGFGFLRRTPIILASITLDMFAVLFGGATALLPIYTKDILFVGASGLGWLRAAPSVGAVGMALVLAHRPPLKRAGPTLILAVIGFGAATIVFGLSRSFVLSLAMLFILGALDNISVVVRNTLALTRTPNEMRGRVSAFSGLFVSISNQMGEFESGLTAALFGPVASVVGGGVATILVVLTVASVFPDLRRLRTLRGGPIESGAEPAASAETSAAG